MLEDRRPPEFGGDCRGFLMPLIKNTTWMKWFGGLEIAIGVFYCITIVGLIIGWLPLWIGLLVYRAASKLQEVEASNDEGSAVEVITKLGTYLKISGIMACLTVVLYAIFASFIIADLIAGDSINSLLGGA